MRPLAMGALGAAGVGAGVVNFGVAGGGGAATTGPLKFGSGSVSITAGDEQPANANTPIAQSGMVSREIFKAIRGPLLFNDDDENSDDRPDACPGLRGFVEALGQFHPSARST
jgi:hypothetical protein